MKTMTKVGLAVLSGLLIAAAWPVRGLAPLAFVAFVPLLYLQEKDYSFWISSITFLIWNALTTWWVWKTTAFGTIGMIVLNSLFMTCVFWAYHFVKTRLYDNKKGYYLLIIFVLAFEYLHLHWQINWPWLNLGNVFSHYHTWVQWYEFTGIAGGTVWVLLANILIYKLLVNYNKTLVISVITILFVPIIISKLLYVSYEEKGGEIEIVVVQPNLDPYTEEFTLTPKQIMERNLSVANPLVTENTRFVVSPESAIQENIWLDKIDKYYSIKELRRFIDKYPKTCYVIGASP